MTQLSHSSPLNDELTRWLFQDSTDGLVLFEPQSLEVVEVNQAAVNLTARSADELIGNPLDAFFVKSAELNQFIGSCRESRCGSPQELRLERPDKTISVVSLDVRTIEIAGGNRGLLRLRTVTSIRDVNETVQAEQALRPAKRDIGRYSSMHLFAFTSWIAKADSSR